MQQKLSKDRVRSFSRYIGIDYSGAETPSTSLKGLRACVASGPEEPVEVLTPASPRKHWTRRGAEHFPECRIQVSDD